MNRQTNIFLEASLGRCTGGIMVEQHETGIKVPETPAEIMEVFRREKNCWQERQNQKIKSEEPKQPVTEERSQESGHVSDSPVLDQGLRTLMVEPRVLDNGSTSNELHSDLGLTNAEVKPQELTKVTVFKCPKCSRRFAKPAIVISHLMDYHGMPMHRIRRIRHRIKEIPYDPLRRNPPTRVSRELKRLLERVTSVNENVEDVVKQKEHVFLCPTCNMTFERRARLAAHIKDSHLKQWQPKKGFVGI